MMSQGRCSARVATFTLLFFLVLHSSSKLADASGYFYVGGPNGWTFNVDSWPRGKKFAVGDTLVFNYNPSYHNVVRVDRAGYVKCRVPPRSKVYQTGRDQIKLVKGGNYFICSFPGHCDGGMKIAISV